MNNELKVVLESVIDDALQPIQNELQQLNKRVGSIGTELKDFRGEVRTTLQVIQTGQQGTREELTQRFTETKKG